MAIIKPVPDKSSGTLGATKHLVLPAFSFATDSAAALALANMIIDAWGNVMFTYTTGGASVTKPLGDNLRDRNPLTHLPTQNAIDCATQRVQAAGFDNLARAVVITEAEHDNDYVLQSDDEIAFVLPDPTRAIPPPPYPTPYSTPLLDTAKLLMACTPNGI